MEFYLNRLKQKREEQGLNQTQLAAESGLTQYQISNWETAKSFPKQHNIDILAKFFNCDPGELFPNPHTLLKEMEQTYKDEIASKDELVKFQANQIIDKNKEITILTNRNNELVRSNSLFKKSNMELRTKEPFDEFEGTKVLKFDEFN